MSDKYFTELLLHYVYFFPKELVNIIFEFVGNPIAKNIYIGYNAQQNSDGVVIGYNTQLYSNGVVIGRLPGVILSYTPPAIGQHLYTPVIGQYTHVNSSSKCIIL